MKKIVNLLSNDLGLFMYPKLFGMLLFSFFVLAANAQKQFNEGVILYNVTIDPPPNTEQSAPSKGIYIITIKGKQLMKELKMDNGFDNIVVSNNNKHYALRQAGRKYFAVELDEQQLREECKKYEFFKISDNGNKENIVGIAAKGATVSYNDGSSFDILYTSDLELEGHIFDRFPNIKVLPLSFSYKNDDGMVTHFKVQKVEQKMVETTLFNIPSDYKIISNKEYNQMFH